MKKMVLFGAQGLLGFDCFRHFSEKYQLFPLSRWNCDLFLAEDITKTLDDFQPEIVLNCAAISEVDWCEKNPKENQKINRDAPAKMAEWCGKNNADFVQISTDFVFDGKLRNYEENAQKNPINEYGKMKAEAEELAQKNCSRTFIVRTARLYGEGGENFANWILVRTRKNREVPVIVDEWGNYTFIPDLVKAIDAILEKGEFGIFHAMGQTSGTPKDFAEKIKELTKSRSKMVEMKSADLVRSALRPQNTTLQNTKISPLRGFENALLDFLKITP